MILARKVLIQIDYAVLAISNHIAGRLIVADAVAGPISKLCSIIPAFTPGALFLIDFLRGITRELLAAKSQGLSFS
jgi:hypothetical protein